MKSAHTAQLLLSITLPVTALSTIATPGQAATFSFSGAETIISNFSLAPTELGTATNTQTLTVAVSSGTATAEADALALFTPNQGQNLSLSQASGSGNNYLGLARSSASLIGRFLLNPQETLSFDFVSRLALQTAVDDPSTETASALGEIEFRLIDNQTNQLIDTFGLFARSSVPNGFPQFQPFSTGSTAASVETASRADRNSQFFSALFSGSYFRQFNSASDVSLIEVKRNQAEVKQVPVPSAVVGIFVFLAQMLRRPQSKKADQKGLPQPEAK